jgi:hypothetical protein
LHSSFGRPASKNARLDKVNILALAWSSRISHTVHRSIYLKANGNDDQQRATAQ